MAQLEFDESLAANLEVLYRRRGVVRRRHLVHDAVDAKTEENVVDVGCGPGFCVREILERVGPSGSVVGIDTAPAMLAIAAKRAAGHTNVSFQQADCHVPTRGRHRVRCSTGGTGAGVRA